MTAYQLNNFDNALYAYNTLFDLMVVNNWNTIMAGHVSMTSANARIFFFVYYLFAVIVVTNVIIALILDSFLTVGPLLEHKDVIQHQHWYQAYLPDLENFWPTLDETRQRGSIVLSSSQRRTISIHQRSLEFTAQIDPNGPLPGVDELYQAFMVGVARSRFEMTTMGLPQHSVVTLRLPVHMVTTILGYNTDSAAKEEFSTAAFPILLSQVRSHLGLEEPATDSRTTGNAGAMVDQVQVARTVNEDGDHVWQFTMAVPVATALAWFDVADHDMHFLQTQGAAVGPEYGNDVLFYSAVHHLRKVDVNRARCTCRVSLVAAKNASAHRLFVLAIIKPGGPDIDQWLLQEKTQHHSQT